MTDKFDVASELKAKIARENDEDRRTTLLLLLGVFEANLSGIAALSEKIDALRKDEKGLREAVLNGHSHRHDKHHDWIEERMTAEVTKAENSAADRREARNAFIRQAVTIVVSVAAGVVLSGEVGRLFYSPHVSPTHNQQKE